VKHGGPVAAVRAFAGAGTGEGKGASSVPQGLLEEEDGSGVDGPVAQGEDIQGQRGAPGAQGVQLGGSDGKVAGPRVVRRERAAANLGDGEDTPRLSYQLHIERGGRREKTGRATEPGGEDAADRQLGPSIHDVVLG